MSAATGTIVPFVGSSAPDNWLLCRGQEVAIATYPELNSVLGTTYGSLTNGSGGAGSTHFRLPDLTGKIVVGSEQGVGASSSGSGAISGSSLTSRALATSAGSETVTLSGTQTGVPSHNHSVTESAHGHQKGYDGHYHGRNMMQNQNIGGSGLTAGKFGFIYDTDLIAPDSTSTVNSGFTVSTSTSNVTINSVAAANAASAHTNLQPTVITNYIIRT